MFVRAGTKFLSFSSTKLKNYLIKSNINILEKYEDYKKAGFKMLPTGNKDKGTAIQIIFYTFWMIVISIVPVFGITGRLQLSITAAAIVLLAGLVMLFYAFRLYEKRDNGSARKLMLASVTYISLIQIIYVVDKFIS